LSTDAPSPRTPAEVLYVLDDDVDTALAQLEDAHAFSADAEAGRRALLDDVAHLLGDPAVAGGAIMRIAAVHQAPQAPACVRGPLGLFLGLNAATALASFDSPNDEALCAARAWLKHDDVVECLYDFYEIERAYIDLGNDAELHRVGTTSVIFRCTTRSLHPYQTGQPRALKCLLPRYFRIQAIRDRTREYAADHSFTNASVPHVYRATDKTIVMDFVEGPTLAEKLAERVVPNVLPGVPEDEQARAVARRRALEQEDIAFIRNALTALCEVLGDLFDDDERHLDLSPTNIIVTGESSDRLELALIDFGHNFAVTERVGSSAAIRRAGLYVAPELLDDPSRNRETSRAAWRCDTYSLGVILLEMAARRRIEKDDLNRELERLWQGDGEWNGALGLARIVEELIDARPEQRLLLMPGSATAGEEPGHGENPYRYLGQLIRQETEVQALYEARSAGVGFGLLKGFALLELHGNIQLRNLLDAQRTVHEPVDDTYGDYPALGLWARVALYSWFVVLTAFVLLTAADLHVYALAPAADALVDALHPPFEVGDFWGNLPGRLVALTFALTQVTYYVNNYSIVSPKQLRSKLGLASESVLRANTILLTIPVMWAMVWQPSAWPLCSGLGTLLVVLNNYLTLRIARRANAVGSRRFSTLGEAGKKFVDDMYSEWWTLMGFYSVSMIAIGILLNAGVAHDAALFAALVVFINVAKMYRLNCVHFAPQVRGCLSRAILTLRRADRLVDEPRLAAAAAPALPGAIGTVLRARRVAPAAAVEDGDGAG
jgi:hypothetical protein